MESRLEHKAIQSIYYTTMGVPSIFASRSSFYCPILVPSLKLTLLRKVLAPLKLLSMKADNISREDLSRG